MKLAKFIMENPDHVIIYVDSVGFCSTWTYAQEKTRNAGTTPCPDTDFRIGYISLFTLRNGYYRLTFWEKVVLNFFLKRLKKKRDKEEIDDMITSFKLRNL